MNASATLEQLLTAQGIPVVGVGTTNGVLRIDFADTATPEQRAQAAQIRDNNLTAALAAEDARDTAYRTREAYGFPTTAGDRTITLAGTVFDFAVLMAATVGWKLVDELGEPEGAAFIMDKAQKLHRFETRQAARDFLKPYVVDAMGDWAAAWADQEAEALRAQQQQES